MRRLRAGVHVVQRDDRHVQVGLDPPARVIAARDPEVLGLLDALGNGSTAAPATAADEAVLRALDDAGLLEAVPTRPSRPPRPKGTVALVDRGLGLGPLRLRLEAEGVTVVPPTASRGRQGPALVVVAAPGPVPRAALDPWVGEGAPHLVLAGTGRPGSLRLGPLVEPGLTACVRCVDATEATLDPRRPLVVEQLAGRPAAPLEPAVVALGLAWAAREVLAFLSGSTPATWSATVDLDQAAPVVHPALRHPHCGCAWDELPY